MVNLEDRTVSITLTTTNSSVEHFPGGFIIRGCSVSFEKRQHRHTNPTRYNKKFNYKKNNRHDNQRSNLKARRFAHEAW